eukprot:scaffold1690_cov182-Amphora_coffeaeformis.AAC.3
MQETQRLAFFAKPPTPSGILAATIGRYPTSHVFTTESDELAQNTFHDEDKNWMNLQQSTTTTRTNQTSRIQEGRQDDVGRFPSQSKWIAASTTSSPTTQSSPRFSLAPIKRVLLDLRSNQNSSTKVKIRTPKTDDAFATSADKFVRSLFLLLSLFVPSITKKASLPCLDLKGFVLELISAFHFL